MDAALRAAHKADTIAKEMSITWWTYPPKYKLGNAGCFNHTGRKCDKFQPCASMHGAQCSKGWCVCPAQGYADAYGCADAYGACRNVPNTWLGMDLRVAPSEDPHQFFAMPTDEGSGPYLVPGWPASANAEALW